MAISCLYQLLIHGPFHERFPKMFDSSFLIYFCWIIVLVKALNNFLCETNNHNVAFWENWNLITMKKNGVKKSESNEQ